MCIKKGQFWYHSDFNSRDAVLNTCMFSMCSKFVSCVAQLIIIKKKSRLWLHDQLIMQNTD